MLQKLFFGKLNLDSIPFDVPIIMGAGVFMALILVAAVIAITVTKKWHYIWSEWISSVDHKKIGIMYILLAFVMLLRGFSDAVLMAVNHGDNSDTTACVTGSLAGIIYGYNEIPQSWIDHLANLDMLKDLYTRFANKVCSRKNL